MLPVLCLSNVKVDLSLKRIFLIYDNSTEDCLDLEPLWSWLESHNQTEKINLVFFQVNEDYTTQEIVPKRKFTQRSVLLSFQPLQSGTLMKLPVEDLWGVRFSD